jgi:hypothetical protein
MDKDRHETDKPDVVERIDEAREAVIAADATGLIASEDLPLLPHEDLHAALPRGHAAHATIDRLRAEIEAPAPSRRSIETHVSNLRSLPEIEAVIANWWDHPNTQRFIWNLSQIGL